MSFRFFFFYRFYTIRSLSLQVPHTFYDIIISRAHTRFGYGHSQVSFQRYAVGDPSSRPRWPFTKPVPQPPWKSILSKTWETKEIITCTERRYKRFSIQTLFLICKGPMKGSYTQTRFSVCGFSPPNRRKTVILKIFLSFFTEVLHYEGVFVSR